jgi:hypothetical protein
MWGWLEDIKKLFGNDSEFVESVQIAAQDRIASPFYGYFLISWLVFNWRIIYSAFFINQENLYHKTGLLRIEYLNSIIPPRLSWMFFFNFFVFPFLLTIFFFWISPLISRFFFRKHIRNKKALKVIELQENQEIKIEEKALTEAEVALMNEQIEKALQERKAAKETPEVLWENEFKKFQNSKIFPKLQQIINSIYSYAGKIHYKNFGEEFDVDNDIIVYADTSDLITFDENRQISLTEKGKFFIKKFSELEAV